MERRTDRMAEQAAKQYGLITAGQLRALGFSDEQRRRLVDRGALWRVRRSVYSIAGAPPCWEQPVLAAALAGGDGAVVSHATAAAVWDFRHFGRQSGPERVHLTSMRAMRLDGVTSHVRRLDRRLRRVHHRIPVTSPELTIADVAGGLDATQLGECIDDALRRGLVRLEHLRGVAMVTAGRGRPRRRLRDALVDRGVGYDPAANEWELAMLRQWRQLGLPDGVPQYRVSTRGRTYRLDLAIPEHRIGVEWNGFHAHGTRSAFDHDSDRRADLTAAGWHILDFTTHSTPERIAGAVRAAMARQPSG